MTIYSHSNGKLTLFLEQYLQTLQGKILIVNHAPSGCGKSSFAEQFQADYPGKCRIFSTDNFWIKDGEYQFKVELGLQAHDWNLRSFKEQAEKTEPCVCIIDNTNLNFAEFTPYWLTAYQNHFNKILDVFFPLPDVPNVAEVLTERNKHSVPFATILRQISKYKTLSLDFFKRGNVLVDLLRFYQEEPKLVELAFGNFHKAQEKLKSISV